MPDFKEYTSSLRMSLDDDTETAEIILHLEFFIDFMELEYHDHLRDLRSLKNETRVSFRLLWGIFIPGTLLVARCRSTGEPIALRLVHVETKDAETDKRPRYSLLCEYTDFNAGVPMLAQLEWDISEFEGDMLLAELPIWPMHVELHADQLRDTLIERGRRYREFSKVWCHKQYSGIAWRQDESGERRIMVSTLLLSQYNGANLPSPLG